MTSKGGTMNAEYMMVNPNDLVIDMPVEDAHVVELMESLERNGMTEPVTVWLQGMRIINGFHRTAAAIRLGWTEMPCLVKDLSEDAFWDARIIAAKPHKAVEAERLAMWMLDSWRLNFGGKMANFEDIREEGAKYGIDIERERFTDEQLQILAMLDAFRFGFDKERRIIVGREIQVVGKTPKGRDKKREMPVWGKRSPTDLEKWFEDKSTKWGCDIDSLVEKLLSAASLSGVRLGWGTESVSDLVASHVVREHIGKIKPEDRMRTGLTYDVEREWMAKVNNGKVSGVSLIEYGKQKLDEDAKRFAEAQQRANEEAARRYAYSQSEQGMAESRKQADIMSNSSNHLVLDMMRGRLSLINANASLAPAMLAEFAEFVRSFIAEHYPDLDTPEVSPVALENSRLRNENQQLRDRVASLERALGSKESAGAMLAGAIAWSSGDLER